MPLPHASPPQTFRYSSPVFRLFYTSNASTLVPCAPIECCSHAIITQPCNQRYVRQLFVYVKLSLPPRAVAATAQVLLQYIKPSVTSPDVRQCIAGLSRHSQMAVFRKRSTSLPRPARLRYCRCLWRSRAQHRCIGPPQDALALACEDKVLNQCLFLSRYKMRYRFVLPNKIIAAAGYQDHDEYDHILDDSIEGAHALAEPSSSQNQAFIEDDMPHMQVISYLKFCHSH